MIRNSGKNRKDRFGRGGCFTCLGCGKRTRETDNENAQVQLCSLCNAQALAGNALSDAGFSGDAWAVFATCKNAAACEALLQIELDKLPK